MRKGSLLIVFLAFAPALFAQAIRVATYQYATNDRIGHLKPLADHLQEKLQVPVTVKSYPTVQAFIEGLQNNEVDLGFINTFGYLLLKTASVASPMQAVAAWSVPADAKDVYKSSFLVHKKNAVLWKDLAKKSAGLNLALVAPGSTSGNLVPRLLFSGIGIDNPESSFKSVRYAGTHQVAVEWVLEGKADLAAMGQDAYLKTVEAAKFKTEDLLEVQVSPEIPLGPALLNQGLTPALQTRILTALLDLHKTTPAAMEGIRSGWTEARKATHFERIGSDHYDPFLQRFGNPAVVAAILSQFAN